MTQRPRYERSTCCVIGCHRTSRLFPSEWICGEHWRMVDRDIKRLRTRILKRRGRECEAAQARVESARAALTANMPAPDRYRLEDLDAMELAQRQRIGARRAYSACAAMFWARIKRQATERALGISA